jgi:hypothetical protein
MTSLSNFKVNEHISYQEICKGCRKELNELQKQQLAQILINITQSKTISEIPDCKKLKGFKMPTG